MRLQTLFQTMFSRVLILVFNFGLVIYSTNIWGSEGKGIISLLTADVAIIVYFLNIFAGSSVTFFASKKNIAEVLSYAYVWSVVVGTAVPLLLGLWRDSEYTFYLMGICVFSSLLTANINLFVGKRNIRMFNFYTLLQFGLHLFLLLALLFFAEISTVEVYFIAQIISLAVLFLISSWQLWRRLDLHALSPSKSLRREIFRYGWKSQLSAFLQFLNNRLSYYFLEFYKGISSVGVFSLGVALSEAIWTASRSLAVILYSDVVNADSDSIALAKTKISIKVSFYLTLVFILVAMAVPAWVYTRIFGAEFYETKTIILLLSPGILAVAVSNIVGFYFAGVNQLRILNLKSAAGLSFTLVAVFYFIPKWGVLGASVLTTVSYSISSAVLLWHFYSLTDFHLRDYLITRQEMRLLLSKFRR